jgi:hypothetical protein
LTRLINPLLFIPSPRDIPRFAEATAKLEIDKLWVKYHPPISSWSTASRLFTEDDRFKEYTHLVILPDDLIITNEHLEMLINDIVKKDYPVLSGTCNVDISKQNKGKYAVCLELPPIADIRADYYKWMIEEDRQKLLQHNSIHKVKHAGFPLMFIRRDIAEKIPLHLSHLKCCADLQFCWDCHDNNVPIYADLTVVGDHLKIRDGVYEYYFVGIKKPLIRFEKI